ncbi:MAG: DUF5686 and carboxypeptidase regulatory-like domain-containing protein [Bacteroidales bacterium]
MLFFTTVAAYAEVLKGSVLDENGAAVSGANLYIHELQLGSSADAQGNFEFNIKQGKYTLSIQSIGYSSKKEEVRIKQGGATLNITLETRAYEIPPVIVSRNREDPAYRIMRKVIAMSPYYSNVVSKYTADVYLKGTAKVARISRMVKTVARKELRRLNVKEGETYLLESINEITFTAPNQYQHRIISSNTTFPKEFGGEFNTMNYINANVYTLDVFATNAFSKYHFTYEGFVEEGDLYISKIAVRPRKKTIGAFTGHIYIIEDTWQVYSTQLTGEFPFGSVAGTLSTNDVQGVRLPTAYSILGNIAALGNEAVLEYTGTVQYKNVQKDNSIKNPIKKNEVKKSAQQTPPQGISSAKKNITPKDSSEKEKRRKELEKLLEKEELSNREMNKLSKLISKGANVQSESLNLSNNYIVKVDSGVRNIDSTYWNAVRPVPLKIEEQKSLVQADSLRKIESNDSLRRRGFLSGLLFGRKYDRGKGLQFWHKGLLFPEMLDFNAADGFRYGQKLGISKVFADTTQLSLDATLRWAFNRKAFMWQINSRYSYLPEKRGRIFISASTHSHDYNHLHRQTQLASLITLITHNNYHRIYEQLSINIGHEIDLINGLQLHTSLAYYNRWTLRNSTNFAFFYPQRNYSTNLPEHISVTDDFSLNNATTASISLSYTPRQFYRMRGREKMLSHSHYPTFTLAWHEGIPTLFNSKANFSLLQVGIQQRIELSLLEYWTYQIEGSYFVRNKSVDFPDFYHFNLPGYAISTNSDNARYYKYSTNHWGIQARTRYTTSFLALKYLPLLNKTYCRENIGAAVIASHNNKVYSELTYGISEIFLILHLGVFVGFENISFNTVGINATIRL